MFPVLSALLSPFVLVAHAASPSPAPAPTWSDFSAIVEAITGVFSTSSIISVLAGIFGAAIGFVFLWFVVKRVVKVVMGAINGGNLSSGAGGRRRGR